MGSPHAFEYRRLELQRNNLPSADLDVTNSFCDTVRVPSDAETCFKKGATGLMLRYLELAQIAVIVGDVLFVHGGIHDFNLGCDINRRLFISFSNRRFKFSLRLPN